jgi:large subunit ribosomal protein L18
VSVERKIKARNRRRTLRVRSKFDRITPRVSVFRSLQNIYAQVIDDQAHKTIASCSSLELEAIKGTKTERAFAVGKELAQRIRAKGITHVVFDRGSFLYHGRVKAVADGLREGGLQI